MTVNDTQSLQPYAGNGTTTAFAIPFPFFSSGVAPEVFPDIEIYLRTISTGAEVLQVYTTHYTVAIDAGTEPQQGDLTMVTAPTLDQEVHIVRSTALTQATAFTVGGPFPAVEHEKALDRAALRTIDQAETLDRGLRFPRTDPETISAELPSSIDRAGKYLAFSSTGAIMMSSSATDTSTTSDFMEDVLASSTEGEAKTLLEIQDMNLLVNPHFQIAQRMDTTGAAQNANDDQYLLDEWKTISDGNARVAVGSQRSTTGAPNGASDYMAVGVQASNKWSEMQVVNASKTRVIVNSGGMEVGLDMYVALTAFVSTLHILKWTGAADAPTSDPISAWEADGVTPTLVASWEIVDSKTLTNTAADTWQRHTLAVDGGISDATNLAFVFGPSVNTPDHTTDTGRFTNSLLVPKGQSTYTTQRTYDEDLRACQATYRSTFPKDTVPADNAGLAGAIRFAASGQSGGGVGGDPNFGRDIRNPVQMLKAGTYAFFNPEDGGSTGEALNFTDDTSTAVDAENISADGARIGPTTTDVADDGDDMAVHMTVKVEL